MPEDVKDQVINEIKASPTARAYARGGFGVKNSFLSLIFYKILLPAQRRLIVFAYFLLVNLST